ncbi:MAG: hypothetical protein ABSA76_00955 [Bacteroidales bacterium]
MKKLLTLLSVLVVSIFVGFAFGTALDIKPIIPGAISFLCSFVPLPGMPAGILPFLVFTTPAAAGTYTFPLNYIPQFIIYDAAAAPLTSLRVDEKDWGNILDLPLAGIADVRMFMRYGLVASTVTRFRLANGNIKGRNVTVTIVQPGAVAVPFFCCSDCSGTNAFKYTTLALLAGQPTSFTNFTALFLSNFAGTDTALINFVTKKDPQGFSQMFRREELLELTSLYQNNQLATGFIINNIGQNIHEAIVTQAAAGAAYMMKVLIPGQ